LRLQNGEACAWSFALAAALAASASAQELEPRAYANAPVGLNFFISGYTYIAGEVATDPALPIENAELSVHGPFAAYAHSFGVAGKAAKVDVVVPYGILSGTADVAGQPRERDVSGLWDPRVRFSINLYGAPALAPREFASYRQNWIVGASVQVGIPVGQYDDTRVVNLGNHRWMLKPEVGVSKALGRWSFEFSAAASLFADNDDYLENRTRSQEPVYSLQTHVVYTFPSRIWIAVDGNYYAGGAVEVDGVRSGLEMSNSRVGVTCAFPFGSRHSLKLYASTGATIRTGGNFDAVGAAWQYRWAGGVR
jgi:hypothetical protein